ncbi:hypothetical protein FM996_00625 [Methylosinus sporium]|uniref:Uncharacterized protein n=1 Tax=Methylosinus sporium TaxID=428 RepID=A0A549T927_METSR|nr:MULTISPECIES: hypothetical protein [Methylosinus]MBU3887731.1 hypothetical protein [Methylosinus sp. KRF6]TRL38366.1 hypothetical protein FM996_00625 [Methylosinus sporium]
MSLRDKLRAQSAAGRASELFSRFGVLSNPFPSSTHTAHNPHQRLPADDDAEERIITFLRDGTTQVVVIEGTQGVGKTNFLNFYESEIQDSLADTDGYYVVRYLADPEASFDGIIRRLFQELGPAHLKKLTESLMKDSKPLKTVRGQDMRSALQYLVNSKADQDRIDLMMEWLLGFRLLKAHREALGVLFRLDTVESKTAALRDLVLVSSATNVLQGIFLLLDELEKQDGVLGPTAVVRYLSAMRAIIDALPRHLFMMIALTPDAMRRYSAALPAFRSRFQNLISLEPLMSSEDAENLADFYIQTAKSEAKKTQSARAGSTNLITRDQIFGVFEQLRKAAERRGDKGVRQREFLHLLHLLAEKSIQAQ